MLKSCQASGPRHRTLCLPESAWTFSRLPSPHQELNTPNKTRIPDMWEQLKMGFLPQAKGRKICGLWWEGAVKAPGSVLYISFGFFSPKCSVHPQNFPQSCFMGDHLPGIITGEGEWLDKLIPGRSFPVLKVAVGSEGGGEADRGTSSRWTSQTSFSWEKSSYLFFSKTLAVFPTGVSNH